MGCAGCPEAPEPVGGLDWVSARVWYAGDAVHDVSCLSCWEKLPEDGMLGAIGRRANGTTDYLSGMDWYGWVPFEDGWRLSGIQGSHAEMERVRARYPGSVWKEGRLVSDTEMDRVNQAMQEYVRALWPR